MACVRSVSRAAMRGFHTTTAAPAVARNDALANVLANGLEEQRVTGTLKAERVITSAQGPEVEVAGSQGDVLNFCANNYLGYDGSRT